jgi:hypothetical protein
VPVFGQCDQGDCTRKNEIARLNFQVNWDNINGKSDSIMIMWSQVKFNALQGASVLGPNILEYDLNVWLEAQNRVVKW